MERDFMGLSSVKQEVVEEPTDSAPARSSAMQWSFSNVSAHPQYLSFKNAQEDKPEIGFDSLASTGLVTRTTTKAVDSRHRTCPGVTRNLITTVNSLPGAGAPVAGSTSVVPSSSAVVGTTDLRGAPKTPPGPAQLTIFYGGSVCVYDNVSPEKAQAIMLLAGNAPPVTPNATTSILSPVQAPIPKSPAIDSFVVNQCHNTTPTLVSPISITSRGGSQSAGVTSNTNGATIIKSIGVVPSPSLKAEPSNVASPVGSFPAPLVPSAVPQARKASLARFLEKRKERVISASPYPPNSKQSPECSTPTPGLGSRSLSMNSSGSCSAHIINLVK